VSYLHPDDIRTQFSNAMSAMYRTEVPQYGTLLELVADVNGAVLAADAQLKPLLERRGELGRLNFEYHGAIRLGTAQELATIRRVFAVMGMFPVGYYDLSVAGVPVHSTAFRPVGDTALKRNPFRVFTSLLRLELIEQDDLRGEAQAILAARHIFTARAIELVELNERQGGLTAGEAEEFVTEALETFRWHDRATVSSATYKRLHDAHRLIADVVSFKGPHINHLTPRTLDIDAVQAGMPLRGIVPKVVIEGPSRRACPILLRQTSFKALEEKVAFTDQDASNPTGLHTARFGEVEQRGVALTPKGRQRYDDLLNAARAQVPNTDSAPYAAALLEHFAAMPDDWATLRAQGLAFFRYAATPAGLTAAAKETLTADIDLLVERAYLQFDPVIYEDFLPVSAAGIFQSNLGGASGGAYAERSNRSVFESALGMAPLDELVLYANAEAESLKAALAALGIASGITPGTDAAGDNTASAR
jgi:uncharacterized glyoxalase superfamily metalloenzyme YdcJ